MKALASKGCQLHVMDGKGRSTLHLAASRGRKDILEYLWSKAIDLEGEDDDGRTPLHLAAANGHVDCVVYLMKRGAFVDTIDKLSMNPLHMAASRGHLDVVRAITDNADLKIHSQVNDMGLTPLGMAVMLGHHTCASYLLQENKIENINGCYYSALHLACMSSDLAMVNLVLENADNINFSHNPSKSTPLHCAAYSGNFMILEKMLTVYSSKEDLHVTDDIGNTPADYVPPDCAERHAILKLLDQKMGIPAWERYELVQNDFQEINEKSFASLSASEQRRKVKHWGSLMLDDPSLVKIIANFREADNIFKGLEKLKILNRNLKVHYVYSHLRQDEVFQEDMRDPVVAKTVDMLRKDPSQYEVYANHVQIGSVLEKLRVAHGDLKCLGEEKLMLDHVLVNKTASEIRADNGSKEKVLLHQIDRIYEEIEAFCSEHPNKREQNKIVQGQSIFSWKSLLLRNIFITILITIAAYILGQFNIVK